jgi:hypothetical protein
MWNGAPMIGKQADEHLNQSDDSSSHVNDCSSLLNENDTQAKDSGRRLNGCSNELTRKDFDTCDRGQQANEKSIRHEKTGISLDAGPRH